MSVKVAVRVRPYNQREMSMNCLLCIAMEGTKTVLLDIGDATKNREFVFDYSFWSHDQFENNEEGLSIPLSPRYADQQYVFNTVGREILDNAWQGYHCCLFAYGQTGAGKSYSMVGYGANRGIVPITCEEIFNRIKASTDPNRTFDVQVSMLEIYNEKVQDLLIPVAKRAAGGLKVREHKVYGVYVEGLTKHPVSSYAAIEASMDLGNRHRTIASTQMNASSSRAHTIIQVEFKSITNENGRSGEKLSVINLVDLAGSEKVGKTGATGDRLKEAGQINKSLSVLGQVISALADKAMGKAKNQVVPYRDSSLTRILQNALGGNSKTLMICAISPANDNYDETLSTLRYADQAKKIKNNATVNESDSERMIRQLKEENDLLKQQLLNMQKAMQKGELNVEEIDELQSNLESNAYFMEQFTKPVQQHVVEEEPVIVATAVPHLTNVNEDPVLNGKVVYPLTSDITRIGRKNGVPLPQIMLGGIGIQDNHASIENVDGLFYIVPENIESSQFLFLNGRPVVERTMLSNDDRLILGTATTLLVRFPGYAHRDFDWEYCWRELSERAEERREEENERQELELTKEMAAKVALLEAENKREREEAEHQMRLQREQFERQLKQLESQVKNAQSSTFQKEKADAEKALREQLLRIQSERSEREQEREMRRRDLEDEEAMKRYRMKEKAFIEGKLKKYLPMIIETNLIAKELKRNVKLEAKLKYVYAEQLDFEAMDLDALAKGQVFIKVTNNEEWQTYSWSLPKFENRYYLIKELVDNFFETEVIEKLTKEKDPFWDPPQGKFIGQAFIKLESLAFLMDNPTDLPLVGEKISEGNINVNLIPTDVTGTRNLSADVDEGLVDEVEDPTDLLNSRFDFLVVIDNASIEENACRDCYVEYSLQQAGKKKLVSHQTEKVAGFQTQPHFNYRKQHTFELMTEELIDYLLTGTICFELYGFEKEQQNQLQVPSEDLDLLMRKKRLTMQNQRRITNKPAELPRRQSRQIIREKINSFQALNPSQMRKPTLSSRPVLAPLQQQPSKPVAEKQPIKPVVEQQQKSQPPQQQPSKPSEEIPLDGPQSRKSAIIKPPEPAKPVGKPISFQDLEKFDTQQPKKQTKKDKDCVVF